MASSNPRVVPGALAAAGGFLMVVGSFIPWVTIAVRGTWSLSPKNGIDGVNDWLLALGLGTLALVSAISYVVKERPSVWAFGVVGFLGLLLALYEYTNAEHLLHTVPAIGGLVFEPGTGIYVVGVGSLATLGAPIAAVMIGAWRTTQVEALAHSS